MRENLNERGQLTQLKARVSACSFRFRLQAGYGALILLHTDGWTGLSMVVAVMISPFNRKNFRWLESIQNVYQYGCSGDDPCLSEGVIHPSSLDCTERSFDGCSGDDTLSKVF